jgi:hypothetical protein
MNRFRTEACIGLQLECSGTRARYWKVREACFRKLKKLK